MVKKTKYPLPSNEEDEVINAGIAQDPDNPEWTDEDFARAKPFEDVFPELHASWKRGRPPVDNPKQQITLRLQADLVSTIRSHGKGYMARVERVLKEAVEDGRL